MEFVEYLNKKKQSLHEKPIYFERQRDDMVVEIAMQYTNSYTENVYSFANNINTHEVELISLVLRPPLQGSQTIT